MIKAVFSKVLLESSIQNGSELKKSGLETRQAWCHGSEWGKKSPEYTDSIRDEVEANDVKILRCTFVQIEHLKRLLKIMNEEK